MATMAATDRLRSFYGEQLVTRTGTLASMKSLGSIASGAASGNTSGAEDGGGKPPAKSRPGDYDVVIDPYALDSEHEGRSSEESEEEESVEGEGEQAQGGDGTAVSGAAPSRSGLGLAAPSRARLVSAAPSAPPSRTRLVSAAPSVTAAGARGAGLRGPLPPSGPPLAAQGSGVEPLVAAARNSEAAAVAEHATAELSGKAVRRRLRRRRGWDFGLHPDELDFTLGRPLPPTMTRPVPTADSDEEPEDDEDGNDEEEARRAEPPPEGPALEAIKSYAAEHAAEVLWAERLRRARRLARATGAEVTVRGRLQPAKRRELARKILKWENREWFASRKRAPPAPPLHPAVLRVIEQWFGLVDDDGSGTLEHAELMAALKASNVPVSPDNISEMIKLMDLDGDGVINWKEFETFFMYEFAAGKNLLSGEYVLPSGVALPFGAMIAKLKRAKLVEELMQGGKPRAKWQAVAEDPVALEDELGMMAAVEVAMAEMRDPSLAVHRTRAAKAVSRLPPHLRSASLARHLERHPEITEKLLHAPSLTPLLLTTMKRMPSTSSGVLARLASQSSIGSSRSGAGGGAGSATGSGPGGGGASAGRTNVDLNVAAALAAGLEWPVTGANFYNKRAKTVLQAVCKKPPEALARSRPAAGPDGAQAGAPGAAADAGAGSAAAAGSSGATAPASLLPGLLLLQQQHLRNSRRRGAGGGSGSGGTSMERRGVSAGMLATKRGTHLMRGNSRRRGGSSSDGDGGSDGGSDGSGASSSSGAGSDVLPWLVNAKRREAEERAELRRAVSGKAKEATRPEKDETAREEDRDDEDMWVSPMLRNWLLQQRKQQEGAPPSAEASIAAPIQPALAQQSSAVPVDTPPLAALPLAAEGSDLLRAMLVARGPVAGARFQDRKSPVKQQRPPADRGLSPGREDLETPLRTTDSAAPAKEAAATFGLQRTSTGPGSMRSGGSTLTGEIPSAARDASAAAIPAAAAYVGVDSPALDSPAAAPDSAKPRKPRRRMRFEDEEPQSPGGGTGGGDGRTLSGEMPSWELPAAPAPVGADFEADAEVEAEAHAGAVFLGSLGPHAASFDTGVQLGHGVHAAAPGMEAHGTGREAEERDALGTTHGSANGRPWPTGPGSPGPGFTGPYSPGAPRLQPALARRSVDEPAASWPAAVGATAVAEATAAWGSRLEALVEGTPHSSGPGAGAAPGGPPLDVDEARELMGALKLDLTKEDTMACAHCSYGVERPTTRHFRAALARMRSAAADLLAAHNLPRHPDYGAGPLQAQAPALTAQSSRVHLSRSPSPGRPASPAASMGTAAGRRGTDASGSPAKGGGKASRQVLASSKSLVLSGLPLGGPPPLHHSISYDGGSGHMAVGEAAHADTLIDLGPWPSSGQASGRSMEPAPPPPPPHPPLPRLPVAGVLASALATARSASRNGTRPRTPSRATTPASHPTSRAASPSPRGQGQGQGQGSLAAEGSQGRAVSRRRLLQAPHAGGGPEHWDAHAAALLQRRMAAELSAVQRGHAGRSVGMDAMSVLSTAAGSGSGGGAPPESAAYVGARSGSRSVGGAGAAAGAGRWQGVAATADGGTPAMQAGLLQVLPARSHSSFEMRPAPPSHSYSSAAHSPRAPLTERGQEPGAAATLAPQRSAVELGGGRVAAEGSTDPLLGVLPGSRLPDFIAMPGAMPRLQSRYTRKRLQPQPQAGHQGEAAAAGGMLPPRLPDPNTPAFEGMAEGLVGVEAAPGQWVEGLFGDDDESEDGDGMAAGAGGGTGSSSSEASCRGGLHGAAAEEADAAASGKDSTEEAGFGQVANVTDYGDVVLAGRSFGALSTLPASIATTTSSSDPDHKMVGSQTHDDSRPPSSASTAPGLWSTEPSSHPLLPVPLHLPPPVEPGAVACGAPVPAEEGLREASGPHAANRAAEDTCLQGAGSGAAASSPAGTAASAVRSSPRGVVSWDGGAADKETGPVGRAPLRRGSDPAPALGPALEDASGERSARQASGQVSAHGSPVASDPARSTIAMLLASNGGWGAGLQQRRQEQAQAQGQTHGSLSPPGGPALSPSLSSPVLGSPFALPGPSRLRAQGGAGYGGGALGAVAPYTGGGGGGSGGQAGAATALRTRHPSQVALGAGGLEPESSPRGHAGMAAGAPAGGAAVEEAGASSWSRPPPPGRSKTLQPLPLPPAHGGHADGGSVPDAAAPHAHSHHHLPARHHSLASLQPHPRPHPHPHQPLSARSPPPDFPAPLTGPAPSALSPRPALHSSAGAPAALPPVRDAAHLHAQPGGRPSRRRMAVSESLPALTSHRTASGEGEGQAALPGRGVPSPRHPHAAHSGGSSTAGGPPHLPPTAQQAAVAAARRAWAEEAATAGGQGPSLAPAAPRVPPAAPAASGAAAGSVLGDLPDIATLLMGLGHGGQGVLHPRGPARVRKIDY